MPHNNNRSNPPVRTRSTRTHNQSYRRKEIIAKHKRRKFEEQYSSVSYDNPQSHARHVSGNLGRKIQTNQTFCSDHSSADKSPRQLRVSARVRTRSENLNSLGEESEMQTAAKSPISASLSKSPKKGNKVKTFNFEQECHASGSRRCSLYEFLEEANQIGSSPIHGSKSPTMSLRYTQRVNSSNSGYSLPQIVKQPKVSYSCSSTTDVSGFERVIPEAASAVAGAVSATRAGTASTSNNSATAGLIRPVVTRTFSHHQTMKKPINIPTISRPCSYDSMRRHTLKSITTIDECGSVLSSLDGEYERDNDLESHHEALNINTNINILRQPTDGDKKYALVMFIGLFIFPLVIGLGIWMYFVIVNIIYDE